jgi:hypothetical protein
MAFAICRRGLAKFLAELVAERVPVVAGSLEALNPACGDGGLLLAFSQAVSSELREMSSLSPPNAHSLSPPSVPFR